VLITVGVGFVAQGPSLTERPAAEAPDFHEVAEPSIELKQEHLR
jgi:hypothetical protein